jgi:exosome complex RNA-binding protein Csl4
VKSINGNALVLTVDGGTDVSVTVASNAKIVQVAPGEKDLKSATPIALTDLQVGDRVLVRGRVSDDAKTMAAVGIIAMKRTDLEAKKAQDRDDWQKRGIGGLVSAVDPSTGTITISTGTGASAKTIAIHTTKNTVLRRYAPDSVQFDDAKPAALDQIKPGDQVRARGTKSADGSEFAADEIVSGTFRNLAGIITAIDASAKTISLTDLISKRPVVVKITDQTQLRKIPAQMAQMVAFRLKGAGAGAGAGAQGGGSAGAGGASAQEGAAAAGGGPPNGGQRPGGAGAAGNGAAGGGRGDFQQIVNRLPASTLADFQKGDAVMVVSTQGTDAGGVTAITVLGGVEPILAATPAGNAAQAMMLSPWSLGGGAPTGDASGGNQ